MSAERREARFQQIMRILILESLLIVVVLLLLAGVVVIDDFRSILGALIGYAVGSRVADPVVTVVRDRIDPPRPPRAD